MLHVQSAFVTSIIHESTQVEHAANTITLTLAANVQLVPGVRFTLGCCFIVTIAEELVTKGGR